MISIYQITHNIKAKRKTGIFIIGTLLKVSYELLYSTSNSRVHILSHYLGFKLQLLSTNTYLKMKAFMYRYFSIYIYMGPRWFMPKFGNLWSVPVLMLPKEHAACLTWKASPFRLLTLMFGLLLVWYSSPSWISHAVFTSSKVWTSAWKVASLRQYNTGQRTEHKSDYDIAELLSNRSSYSASTIDMII